MSDKSRRNLLKTIMAGSGAVVAAKSLPESWTKPVVDSVILPSHAQTSPCTPCLVAQTYCVGGGQGSIVINVAIDGTVTVDLGRCGIATDTVDPCTGGTFEVDYADGNGCNNVSVTGTIPCGVTDSIQIVETDGQGSTPRTATTGNCV